MENKISVGIDALSVYIPKLYLDLTAEWAQVRAPQLGEPSVEQLVSKVRKGVGVVEMALTDAHEDSATMAANAAIRAIAQAQIDPKDIGYIAIGTETTVDQSKSISAYVLGMLERYYKIDLREVGTPQFQFACIGASYALEAALNLFRAGEETKPYALVIATDISRYPLQSPGEYTQGAGAAALIVCKNPRLLQMDAQVTATVTKNERDFFRPNGMSTAVVDGKYSIDVYLDCMQEATDLYIKRFEERLKKAELPLDQILDHFIFHVPFPRMGEYAAARILGQAWLKNSQLKAELVAQVPLSALATEGAAQRRAFEKQLMASELFKDFFGRYLEPSLIVPRRVGNIYSGSMYMSLASLLESSADVEKWSGQRVGFFSYGSGASARVFSGVFVDPVKSYKKHLVEQLRPISEGGLRAALTMHDYERLHRGPDGEGLMSLRQPAESVQAPRNEFALLRIGAETSAAKTDLGYRYYDWVE